MVSLQTAIQELNTKITFHSTEDICTTEGEIIIYLNELQTIRQNENASAKELDDYISACKNSKTIPNDFIKGLGMAYTLLYGTKKE